MVSTSDSDFDNLSSNLSRTYFNRWRDRCKKGQSRLFPTVQPSLLEFMHCVADGLGYLIMVSYCTTVRYYARLSEGAVHVRCKSLFLQVTAIATSKYVCLHPSPNTSEGHYILQTAYNQQTTLSQWRAQPHRRKNHNRRKHHNPFYPFQNEAQFSILLFLKFDLNFFKR